MVHRVQRRVGGIEHRALWCRRGVGEAGGVPDVFLQQRTGDRREPVERAAETGMLPSALLVADPLVSTSHSRLRSMPRDSPSSSVLIALPRLAVNSTLFRILVTCPLPTGPRCTIGSA